MTLKTFIICEDIIDLAEPLEYFVVYTYDSLHSEFKSRWKEVLSFSGIVK